MDNFEDKHIDNFFRDGSEQHAFPFKESSWDKMESLLEEDKKKKAFGWYLTGFVLIAVLIGGGLWYSLSSNKKDIQTSSQEQFAGNEIISTPEKNETFNTKVTKEITTVSNKEINSSQNFQQVIGTKNSEAKLKSSSLSVVNESTKDFTSSPHEKTFTVIQKSEVQNNLQKQLNTVIAKPRNVIENTLNEDQIKNKASNKTFEQSIPLPLASIKLSNFERTISGLKEREIPFSKIKKSNSNFTLGLVAGMEYSSVGFMSKSRGGYRFGAELSYQFKNRLEITSGFIVSQKKYITEAQNYSFSAGALMDNIMPMMVHGKCDVMEIPVEFSYYLKNYDQSSFYFSLGASTFLMRKEWYDFEYEKMYDGMDDLPRTWADNGLNNHLFGIGTIAIGYQKNINNMAFQIEPYFQVPFTGIGTGQVNLVSGGLQLKVLFKK